MSSSSSPRHHGIDRDALLRVVEPVVRAHGAELVDVEFRPGRDSSVLRVFVEKEGAAVHALSTRDAAVSLELCANVSRDLSPALDVVDLVPGAYQLEVSSPGVERSLRHERDFVRFKGHKAKLKRRNAATAGAPPGAQADEKSESRVVVGVIEGVSEGKVHVVEGKRTHEVPLSSIESANLVFEFGLRGRDAYPGKPEHRKH
jgi:ribosome maturation factor RimP